MTDQAPAAQGQEADALESFIGKWRARWPEWAVAEVFVPHRQRETALAWAALQQELIDAAWGGSDPRPGEAKLAWWQEELHGWSQGRRRHPLGTVLQRWPAPWTALAAALPTLTGSRDRPRDLDEALAALHPFGRAVAEIERALFDEMGDAMAVATDPSLVAATLLQARFFQSGDQHVPLSVLARAGEGEPVAIWRQQLDRGWPAVMATTRPRRLWATLARARLRQADATAPLPRWRTLWSAWQAARSGYN